ncbi:cytochrome P450 [Diaporthe sp. PMI_573]|nr:cytochrome P450 [Diaporthaceae sp. PMI_573]
MSIGTYYLLSDPDKLQKLRDELRTVPKNDQGLYEYKTVRRLPYLNACIKESSACHYLPGETSVSSAILTVYLNPDIFPNPDQFIPELWLTDKNTENYLVVFGKGSRACIGLNLFETNEQTVDWTDYGNSMIKQHVKVKVTSIGPQ